MSDDHPTLQQLRSLTDARIGLGRTGASQPTRAVLSFALDHARARDAVQQPLDVDALERSLNSPALRVCSAAADRTTYLSRPDLGARLAPASADALSGCAEQGRDLVIVLADGLSSRALDHAAPLLAQMTPGLSDSGWRLAPLVIATQARVALGDEIGERLRAAMALVLIGERPGLSAADSLGAYLTWAPKVGRTNAERNCVSNIRPEGLPPADAARTLLWLLNEARRMKLTGIGLKDQSDLRPLPSDQSLPRLDFR